jgi:hypothetical protein
MDSEFQVVVVGNSQTCRTEAEVSRLTATSGADFLAVVYESPDGWQVESDDPEVRGSGALRDSVLVAGREALEPYVNRRGDRPPEGLSVAGLSLWLMEKADGTAMGKRIG